MTRHAIIRQAATRLAVGLGLFILLVALSTTYLYQAAISKAASERTQAMEQFYRSRLAQLEHEWELQSRDFRVRIELSRLLEDPATATLNLQAFLTVRSTNSRFAYLHIEDRAGQALFNFGTALNLSRLPFAPQAGDGYYHDPDSGAVYRVYLDQIWLGERGNGRIALFYRIDHALLHQLAMPGVGLTAFHAGTPFASSRGAQGIAAPDAETDVARTLPPTPLPWSATAAAPVTLTVEAPYKTLFSTAEITMVVSVIPLLDALVLWFTIGVWLMRQARRIDDLGAAVDLFSTQGPGAPQLPRLLAQARQGKRDEIREVADTIGQLVELTAAREQERQQQDTQRRLWSMVFASSNEAILITDRDNRIITVNPAFTQLTGYSEDEVRGHNPSHLSAHLEDSEFFASMWQELTTSGRWQGEIHDRRKDGSIYPKWLSIASVRDASGVVCNYVATFSDISERKANEARIAHLATHDLLTGLPNRMLLLDRLNEGLTRAHRHKRLLAVLFLDLDRFKWVNDSLGHEQGDRLLVEVATRLRATLRESDTVARIGGDEFVIVLHDIQEMNHITTAAQKVVEQMARPIVLHDRDFQVTTSVGISVYPHDGDDADLLLKHADTAMYAAKAAGKNQACFFDPSMNQYARERLELANGLRAAIAGQQLHLVYQPKHHLQQACGAGAEALLRWDHPELGPISPARFIPIAEETRLIVVLGTWVLREACRQIRQWHDAGIDPGAIAVNVSAQQLETADFTTVVQQTLAEFHLSPACLELELTESAVLQNPDRSIATLEQLRGLGIRLSLDDFGTGYSSLAYLKRLPVHNIKIDRSFVDGLPHQADDAQIVQMTVALAKSVGLGVIAEGVETRAQLDYLINIGCELVQGYYVSRPLPAEHYAAWLAAGGFRLG